MSPSRPTAAGSGPPSPPISRLRERPEAQRAPSASSHRSHRSTTSLHGQQGTYVPSGTPLAPRLGAGLVDREAQDDSYREAEESGFAAAFGAAGLGSRSRSRSRSKSPSTSRSRPVGTLRISPKKSADASDDDEWSEGQGDGSHDRADSWDNMRDGSVSRRPAWRRPSPRWVLPFILGACVSLGMTLAARAELYLDLACLVHPPRMPSSSNGMGVAISSAGESMVPDSALDFTPFWPVENTGDAFATYANSSIVRDAVSANGLFSSPAMTPGERWFHWAQQDIIAYLRLQQDKKDSNSNSTIPLPSDPNPGKGPEQAPSPTPFPEIDPAQCKRDAGVQQTSAKLTQILTVVGGLLSAITTGWWARYSDHKGRTRVLAVVELGMLLNDACFLFVALHPRLVIQTKLWILLVGPTIDGLLGGFSTITAALHAYIADVTPDGSRATAFSRLGGVVMAGMAVGPVLGSALIDATGNLLAPFYLSVSIHALFVILIRFVLPESLSSDSRLHLKKRAEAAKVAARERDASERAWEIEGDEDTPAANGDSGFSRLATPVRRSRVGRRAVGELRRMARRATLPLQPLAVFLPHRDHDGRWNCNLLCMGILNFLVAQMIGVVQVKAQYTFWAFEWTPSQLGPYMSAMSGSRLIVLLVLLPLAMRRIKPWFEERTVVEADASDAGEWSSGPSTERTPLLSTSSSPASPVSPASDPEAPEPKRLKRSAKLDLYVVRCCLAIEFAGFLTMGLNIHASAHLFVFASLAMTLGAPGAPAGNSLALSFLEHKRDAGRLFGGLAVLHAIGTSLVAPILFFSIFSATVDKYAPTVFVVAAGMLAIAQLAMLFVRVPQKQEEERGRGRAAKKTRSRSTLRPSE